MQSENLDNLSDYQFFLCLQISLGQKQYSAEICLYADKTFLSNEGDTMLLPVRLT